MTVTTVYLSTTGDDGNSGMESALAVATLSRCAELAGDYGTCLVLGGRYRATEETLTGLVGVTFAAADPDDDPPVFDGTLEIPASAWLSVGEDVWEASVDAIGFSPWQLFFVSRGEEEEDTRRHVGLARWPDALPWTEDAYDRDGKWRWVGAATDHTDTQPAASGTIVDDKTNGDLVDTLAATGLSFQDCVAVLNIGHWKTMAGSVDSHEAGSATFTFSNDDCAASCPRSSYNADGKGRYFMEACEAALTTANEWSYRSDLSSLLVKTEPGIDPSVGDVTFQGKNATWALVLDDCTNTTVRGFTFFSTTMGMWKQDDAASGGNRVEGCTFSYPNFARRALHEVEEMNPDEMGAYYDASGWYPEGSTIMKYTFGAPTFVAGTTAADCDTSSTWFDNVFEYTDGNALYFAKSGGDTLENNAMLQIDYAAVGNAFTIDAMSSCGPMVYRRNTVDTAGAASGFRVGTGSVLAELNYHTNMGLVMYDGASMQAGVTSTPGTVYRYNWVEDTDKLAYRFDCGEDGVFGYNGTMHHNVAVRSLNGFQIKGFNHMIAANLAFDSGGESAAEDVADVVGVDGSRTDVTIMRCYPCGEDYPSAIFDCNNDTQVINNGGGVSATGATFEPIDWLTGGDNPYAHSNYNDNLEATAVERFLRDSENRDYRPRNGSALVDAGAAVDGITDGFIGSAPDIGPYEMGASSYWLPGRRAAKATFPVPPDGTETAMPDADLMWLGALGAESHRLYFGDSPDALEFHKTFTGDNNIFTPPHKLLPGVPIYWRVDAESGGVSTTGDVWSATALSNLSISSAASFDTYWFVPDPETNDGFNKDLILRGGEGASGNDRVAAVQFDLSEPSPEVALMEEIGCSASVTSAYLRLSAAQNALSNISCFEISDNSWNETSRSGPPGYGAQIGAVLRGPIPPETEFAFDVTAQVAAALSSDDDLSIGIKTTDSQHNRRIWSRQCTDSDCAGGPKLVTELAVVCPTPVPTAAPSTTPSATPSASPPSSLSEDPPSTDLEQAKDTTEEDAILGAVVVVCALVLGLGVVLCMRAKKKKERRRVSEGGAEIMESPPAPVGRRLV